MGQCRSLHTSPPLAKATWRAASGPTWWPAQGGGTEQDPTCLDVPKFLGICNLWFFRQLHSKRCHACRGGGAFRTPKAHVPPMKDRAVPGLPTHPPPPSCASGLAVGRFGTPSLSHSCLPCPGTRCSMASLKKSPRNGLTKMCELGVQFTMRGWLRPFASAWPAGARAGCLPDSLPCRQRL